MNWLKDKFSQVQCINDQLYIGLKKYHYNKAVSLFLLGLCIEWLYIMAFTSGVTHAGSDDSHEVSMRLVSGETQTVILPDRPGDDYLSHKGDLWKLSFVDNFRFSDTCVQLSEIASIALEEHSNDGWNIDSVVTFFRDDSSTGNDFHLASVDMDVFQWIDGDDLQSHRRFELNLVI